MQTKETTKDRGLNQVSAEPWEVEYIHRQLPTHSQEEITRAADECKRELHGSTNRDEILNCVRRKLS